MARLKQIQDNLISLFHMRHGYGVFIISQSMNPVVSSRT